MILSPGRSGSQLLVDLLHSQPGVRCDGEILNHKVRSPRFWIQAHAARAGLEGNRVYGFKVLVSQLHEVQRLADPARFIRDLAASGWLIVALTRSNLLRQAVSWVRASEQDRYHHHGSVSGWGPPVRLEPEHAIAMMFFQEEATRFISRALTGIDHVALTYEHDLAHSTCCQATVDRVMDALGLPSASVRSDMVRGSPPALADSIANYDELAALIAQTRFASFLDEG